ncbi:MAG: DUF2703 domain-containing protein [Actinomycetota bacterium]|nr:DUF2703 domain-containing protein [Actinomycetota bacterium]
MDESCTRAPSPRVELLWWSGCPSTPRALAELRTVLSEAGLDPEAIEVRQVETDKQALKEGFVGSPTIRVDGRDVERGSGESPALTCRLYRLRDGRFSPTPDPDDLRAALKAAARGRG